MVINKLYVKIIDIIKSYYKVILVYLAILLVFCFPLPFYINTTGGLISVSDKIKIKNGYEMKGSINLAYVAEMKATIPTYLISLVNKNWDLIKKEEVVASNETTKEASFRDHIMLEEANDDAIILAFNKANINVDVNNEKVFITYIDSSSITDLKIGDEIKEVNGEKILSKQDLYDKISKFEVGDTINFKVIRNGKEKLVKAKMINYENRKMIGLLVSSTKDVKTDRDIVFDFTENESGPSGGLMMSLAIYNYITKYDITKGKKIVGTGTIDIDGKVGSIGGAKYKLRGAVKEKADVFIVPDENYDEVLKEKKRLKSDILILKVTTFDETLEKLRNI